LIVSQYEEVFDKYVEITPYTYADVDTREYNPAIEGFYDYLVNPIYQRRPGSIQCSLPEP
jgi:hypothetical protein